jgi:hypothetical protein
MSTNIHYHLVYYDDDGNTYTPSDVYESLTDAIKDAEMFIIQNKAFLSATVYDTMDQSVCFIESQKPIDFGKLGEAVDLSKLQDQAEEALSAIKLE